MLFFVVGGGVVIVDFVIGGMYLGESIVEAKSDSLFFFYQKTITFIIYLLFIFTGCLNAMRSFSFFLSFFLFFFNSSFRIQQEQKNKKKQSKTIKNDR